MTQAFTGSGYVQSIVAGRDRRLPAPLPRRGLRRPSTWRCARASTRRSTIAWFSAVIEVINNVTMLSIILTGAALIREREHGTIEHLLVMPVTPLEIMVGQDLVDGAGRAGRLRRCRCIFVVQGLLGVPIEGSMPLFLAGAALHLFATTSMGIFLGTVARLDAAVRLLLMLVLLPLQMLSGGQTPRESMPEVIQIMMPGAPTTHFVTLAQAILFRGAGLETVWPQLVFTAAIGVLLFAVALGWFRRALLEAA